MRTILSSLLVVFAASTCFAAELPLLGVTINPESRVSVVEGPVAKRLIQGGWATFLIKMQNHAGITQQLKLVRDSAHRPAHDHVGPPSSTSHSGRLHSNPTIGIGFANS